MFAKCYSVNHIYSFHAIISVKIDIASLANKNSEVDHNSLNIPYRSEIFPISLSSNGTDEQVEGDAFLFSITSLCDIFKTLTA